MTAEGKGRTVRVFQNSSAADSTRTRMTVTALSNRQIPAPPVEPSDRRAT